MLGDPKKRVKREREVEIENLRERPPREEERTRPNANKQKTIREEKRREEKRRAEKRREETRKEENIGEKRRRD